VKSARAARAYLGWHRHHGIGIDSNTPKLKRIRQCLRVPAMMPLTHRIHRAKLLSFLLCGVLCPVHAFAVRTRTRPVSSPAVASRGAYCRENRLHLIIRGSTDLSTNHSNKSRSDTVLSVASGGADGPSNLEKCMAFTSKNFFLLGMVAAVSLARAFPHVSTVSTVMYA